MSPSVVLLAFLCFSTVSSDPNGVIVPCKKSDEVCMARSANVALPIIAAGLPSLGVDGFDPARVPVISGEASNFIFNFTRNEITGYKDCVVSDVKLHLDAWKLKFDLTCPKLVLTGHIVVSGELLDVPVEGDEDYKLSLERYLIKVDADIGKVEDADGHQHLKFKTFKHQGVLLGPSEFHYVNFKPRKALSLDHCIVEGRGAYKRGAKFCPVLDEEKADVECVLGTDSQRQCYLDSVLSTVLKIINTDGPLPMRNLRPAKKNRTAVDRFKETHEAEYKARSASSGDVIKRIHDQISAYPKLRDELDKRKSTIKVNAYKMANNCDDCGKPVIGLKKRTKTGANGAKKKRTYQKRCKENNSRHSTTKKITKKRANRKKIIEIYNRSKVVGKEGKETAARARVTNGAKAKPLEMDVDEDLVTIYSQRKSKSRSDVSLSTYRSYPSTEHEPMV